MKQSKKTPLPLKGNAKERWQPKTAMIMNKPTKYFSNVTLISLRILARRFSSMVSRKEAVEWDDQKRSKIG